MRRREFIALFGRTALGTSLAAAAAGWPLAGRAQQAFADDDAII
jgi:hypothetical protein